MMKFKLDRGLQAFLKKHAAALNDDRVDDVHRRLMAVLDHTQQDEPHPSPARPVPAFRRYAPAYRAAILGLTMLMLGIFIGRGMETAPLQQTDRLVLSGQKISVLAMASPWGEWIEEGE